jgi:NAD-dependent SIR2 family protein deacetylase
VTGRNQEYPAPDPVAVREAAAAVAQADGIVIAAGAGMGVDSGLPDFRGNAGFWRAYPALAAAGIAFMDIATPRAFHTDLRRAWGFYGHRLALYRQTVPHAGFGLLRKWADTKRNGCFVFTSNVDGHFQKAGFDPARIDECHGSIHYLQCMLPCSPSVWEAGTFAPRVDTGNGMLLGPVPACPHCGGPARPNILMFDDWQWTDVRREAQAARLRGWLETVRRPVVIEIGAGVSVATVRHFAHGVVRQHDGTLVRINPREAGTTLPGTAVGAGALQTLTAIDALL